MPTQRDRNKIEELGVEQKNRYPNRYPCECLMTITCCATNHNILSLADEGNRPKLSGSTTQEQYYNASFINVTNPQCSASYIHIANSLLVMLISRCYNIKCPCLPVVGLQAEEVFCGHSGSTAQHYSGLVEDGVESGEQDHCDAL